MINKLKVRIRYRKLGEHMHCRVFTCLDPNQTFGLVGNMIIPDAEWFELHGRFAQISELIPEDGHDGRGIAFDAGKRS